MIVNFVNHIWPVGIRYSLITRHVKVSNVEPSNAYFVYFVVHNVRAEADGEEKTCCTWVRWIECIASHYQ